MPLEGCLVCLALRRLPADLPARAACELGSLSALGVCSAYDVKAVRATLCEAHSARLLSLIRAALATRGIVE